jgi:pre-mRNA-splicing factor SYF1
LDVVETYAEDVGIDPDESDAVRVKEQQEASTSANGKAEGEPSATAGDKPYEPEEDPANPSKLDVERIVKKDGLEVYKDQAGRLWTGLATYWSKRGEFDRVCFSSSHRKRSTLIFRENRQNKHSNPVYQVFSQSAISLRYSMHTQNSASLS